MVLIYDSVVGGIVGRRIRRTDAAEVATLEAVKLRYHNFYSIREADGYVAPI